jgi:hypothetical protein
MEISLKGNSLGRIGLSGEKGVADLEPAVVRDELPARPPETRCVEHIMPIELREKLLDEIPPDKNAASAPDEAGLDILNRPLAVEEADDDGSVALEDHGILDQSQRIPDKKSVPAFENRGNDLQVFPEFRRRSIGGFHASHNGLADYTTLEGLPTPRKNRRKKEERDPPPATFSQPWHGLA